MYVPLDQLVDQFSIICKRALSHTTCKLVIFVSCLDVDALCSAKMLSQLFKSNLIPHKIVPIAGFEELSEAYQAISNDEEITTIICVGCCGTVDLLSFLGIDPDEDDQVDRIFYILDNNRPWNLENLFSSQKVICFYDEDTEEGSYIQSIQNAFVNAIRIYEEQNNENSDEDEDGFLDNEDEEDEFGTRRRTTHAERVKKRRQTEAELEKYEERLTRYYNKGSYVSTAISTTVYTLLSNLGVVSLNSLWFSIVGSTSLDARHPHIYKILFPVLKSEVLRLSSRATNSLDAQGRHVSPPTISTASENGDDDALYPEPDYLFFLLRHWSLFESMMHSSYISAKLKLYTDDGRRKLKTMLAKMGISLHDAREQWTHTNITVKKTLLQKLTDVAHLYGIEDVVREGIIRRFGFKGSVSAGDCVDALATILQIGHMIETANHKSHGDLSSNNNKDESELIGKNLGQVEEATRERFWVPNFWNAWDAMDRVDKLMEGIDRAKSLQQMVVLAATQLFEKRQIKNLKSYRLAVIQDGPDLEFFSNPLALTRLALWISDACAAVKQDALPLVVASLYPPTNTYLVLGMGPRRLREQDDIAVEMAKERQHKKKTSGKVKRNHIETKEKRKKKMRLSDEDDEDEDEEYGGKRNTKESSSDPDEDEEEEEDEEEDEDDDEPDEAGPDPYFLYNSFSSRFHKVSEAVKAAVRVDAFDSSIIEIAREDLSRFLEELTDAEGMFKRRRR